MISSPHQAVKVPAVTRPGEAPYLKLVSRADRSRQCPALPLGLALLCLLVTLLQGSAQEALLPRLTLNVGFTRSSFRNVNASDATAAFRVFAQTVARKRGYQLDTEARLFESPAACQAEIKKGTINMAVFDTWDYLDLNLESVMEPVFVHKEQDSVFKDYLLLSRRGSGLTVLADLQGKELMVLEGKGGDLSRAWLDSLLLTNHLGGKETFFRKLEPVTKPAAAVLPVFFGTKPACLVDRAALQIMSELNPQVGSNLLIIAVSDSYLESITCLSKSGWASEKARQDVIQAVTDLHSEPNGRQILELFKLSQMVPFKDEYLNTTRKLRAAAEFIRKQNLASLPSNQTRSTP